MKSKPQEEGKLAARLRDVLSCGDVTDEAARLFRRMILTHYRYHGRKLPWRSTRDPYRILVSEIMLQQTQVDRVIPKYELFVATFPDFRALAAASLRDILTVWQGLGYNRRAMQLKALATTVVEDYAGKLPTDVETLMKLPGIGRATASEICAFAFDQPTVFIETNIRSVFIHFFFPDDDSVPDSRILPLIERTVDKSDPRRWYYALMDYGTMLKKTCPNPNRRSAHHHGGSRYEGSDRQVRGKILTMLLEKRTVGERELARMLGIAPQRASAILSQMKEEGFLTRRGRGFALVR